MARASCSRLGTQHRVFCGFLPHGHVARREVTIIYQYFEMIYKDSASEQLQQGSLLTFRDRGHFDESEKHKHNTPTDRFALEGQTQ